MKNTPLPVCPECGAELDVDAPDAPCPACLMKLGLESWAGRQSKPSDLEATHLSAQSFDPPTAAELSGQLPNLEVLELLGQGGMGAVYKARQTSLDRIVALKLIRPDAAEVPGFAERFAREARQLARLNHPNIVTVHDFGEVEGLFFLIMEYVEGTDLRQLIEGKDLEPRQALTIIPSICEALQYAHEAGIVHRDIKPANILIDVAGRVKIADFGLARLTGGNASAFTLTGTRQIMGTPRYMAPEQMEGSHSVDHRADIYSLGVVFYEMLTGEVPLGQFEPPSKKAAVDVRLDEIVLRALAREPERRFQTVSELKSSVDAISAVRVAPLLDSRSAAVPRAGVSTIMEREAVAAWRWVAGEPNSASENRRRPELPALLMVLLSVVGCLTVLLPWIDVEISGATNGEFAEPADALASRFDDQLALCYWQDDDAAAPQDMSGAIDEYPWNHVIREPRHIFYGLDRWPGIVVCVTFGVIALLLIMLPQRHRQMVRWSFLLTLLAGVALLHTFLFRLEVNSSQVRLVPERTAFSDSQPQHQFVVFQDPSRADLPRPLIEVEHRLTYRVGFFSAFGLSVTLLVLSATGIRHAVAESAENVASTTPSGTLRAKGADGDIDNQFGSPDVLPSSRPLAQERTINRGAENAAEPRFSRKAIVGACLIPVFLVAAALIVMPVSTKPQAGPPGAIEVQSGGPGMNSIVMIAILGLPGLLAPMITTILGFTAVSEIRLSQGRLIGLGLAFFDAAIYPFLIVDALFFAVIWSALYAQNVTPEGQTNALFVVVTVLILANSFVARRLWRSVTTE